MVGGGVRGQEGWTDQLEWGREGQLRTSLAVTNSITCALTIHFDRLTFMLAIFTFAKWFTNDCEFDVILNTSEKPKKFVSCIFARSYFTIT